MLVPSASCVTSACGIKQEEQKKQKELAEQRIKDFPSSYVYLHCGFWECNCRHQLRKVSDFLKNPPARWEFHFSFGRKEKLSSSYGRCPHAAAICFSPVLDGMGQTWLHCEAIQKLTAATPESMEIVQKELEETMKLHLEALIIYSIP